MCLDCWMIKLENNSKAFRFRCALFIVVDQISASGYGHLVPYTDDHIILNCILLLVGRILEFYIAGKSSSMDFNIKAFCSFIYFPIENNVFVERFKN